MLLTALHDHSTARIHENGDGKENKINVAGEWGAYEMVGKDWGNVSGGISSFMKFI